MASMFPRVVAEMVVSDRIGVHSIAHRRIPQRVVGDQAAKMAAAGLATALLPDRTDFPPWRFPAESDRVSNSSRFPGSRLTEIH